MSWEFVRWVWTWHCKHGHLIDTVRQGLGDKPLFVLRSRKDTEALLLELRHQTS